MKTMDELLQIMVQAGASDLHVKAGSPPVLRVDGELKPLDLPVLTPEDTKDYAASQADFQFKSVGPVKVHANADFGLQSVRDWAPFVVAALVAIIWTTFIVVFLRVVIAMRAESGKPTPAKP